MHKEGIGVQILPKINTTSISAAAKNLLVASSLSSTTVTIREKLRLVKVQGLQGWGFLHRHLFSGAVQSPGGSWFLGAAPCDLNCFLLKACALDWLLSPPVPLLLLRR